MFKGVLPKLMTVIFLTGLLFVTFYPRLEVTGAGRLALLGGVGAVAAIYYAVRVNHLHRQAGEAPQFRPVVFLRRTVIVLLLLLVAVLVYFGGGGDWNGFTGDFLPKFAIGSFVAILAINAASWGRGGKKASKYPAANGNGRR